MKSKPKFELLSYLRYLRSNKWTVLSKDIKSMERALSKLEDEIASLLEFKDEHVVTGYRDYNKVIYHCAVCSMKLVLETKTCRFYYERQGEFYARHILIPCKVEKEEIEESLKEQGLIPKTEDGSFN